MSVPCKNYRTYCRVAYCRINLNHDETTETMKNKRRFRRFVVVRFFTIQEKYSFFDFADHLSTLRGSRRIGEGWVE